MAKKKEAPLKVQAQVAAAAGGSSKKAEEVKVQPDTSPNSVPVYVDTHGSKSDPTHGARLSTPGAGVKAKPTFTTAYLRAQYRNTVTDLSFRAWCAQEVSVSGRVPATRSKAAELVAR